LDGVFITKIGFTDSEWFGLEGTLQIL